MSILYQYYNTGADDHLDAYESRWWAQTFTTVNSHTITAIKLLVYHQQSGSDPMGTATIGIKATSSGHPDGSFLCSTTLDPTTLTTNTEGEWKEFTFSPGYALAAATKYAIVIGLPDTTSSASYLAWMCDGSSPSYTGGNAELNTVEGDDGEWSAQAYDFMFEEYGGLGGEQAGLYAIVEERFHYVDAYGIERYVEGTAV